MRTPSEPIGPFAIREETEEDPDCQIAGCDRPGTVPRKMRSGGDEEPVYHHYLCQYHHRLFLGIKIAVVSVLLLITVWAFFAW